jgi:superfamily I DNA/RNA helicase
LSGQVHIYSGQAGTGKTTRLIDNLKTFIQAREWNEYESVLAITFMHGSRKRLESKLNFIKKDYKVRYKCTTIDSFALVIANRFRSYIGIKKIITVNIDPDNPKVYEPNDFELCAPLNIIKGYCIKLLEFDSVKSYIKNSYPVIIIDEFQDCHGELFEIIQRLGLITNLLIATDQFQQLLEPENTSGLDWIKANKYPVTNLDGKIWRTKNQRLLISAKALRTGSKVNGHKINVYARPGSKGVASAKIKEYLFYWLTGKKTVAIIYPSKSNYVKNAIDELSTKYKFKWGTHKGRIIGPYNHLVSTITKTTSSSIAPELNKKEYSSYDLQELLKHKHFVIRKAAALGLRKLRLRNIVELTESEFNNIINQLCHTYDNFILNEKQSKIISTTVHGAKNREFDNVIILWPYQVSGNNIYKRKLLYNAITRAKSSAIIIVQHNNIKIEELKNDNLFGLLID